MQTLLEQVEVEREYDEQLWNHIKGQHASAFASKTVLSAWCTHLHSEQLTHTFLFDFGGQKLDSYYDLFMLALFENIRLFVVRVENYSIRTK